MSEESVQKPRNAAEILRWLIFEPELLREYSDTIVGWKARLQAMVMPMIWIAIGCFLIHLLLILLIAGFDLPMRFAGHFKEILVRNWTSDFWENTRLYYEITTRLSSEHLVLSLSVCLMWASRNLAVGLAVGLAAGLILGAQGAVESLAAGWIGGLATGVALGLAGGLVLGLAGGLEVGLVVGLFIGLIGGLLESLRSDLVEGLTGSLAFLTTWLFFTIGFTSICFTSYAVFF